MPLSFLIRPQPAWVTMWTLAFALYAASKACSWPHADNCRIPRWTEVAYLIAWPGMNADRFLKMDRTGSRRPTARQWAFAFLKLLCGCGLLLIAVTHRIEWSPIVCGWTGMIGIAFILHFGLFHILSLTWRQCGLSADPIMNWPIAATSLSDFWGNRWNRAFRDFTHRFLFRPLAPDWGPGPALLLSFVISGLVHELVISVPAQRGYGGPTLYFTIQGFGVLAERRVMGRRPAPSGSVWQRLFCMAIVLLPLPLLFHQPFVCNVIVPFLQAMRSTP